MTTEKERAETLAGTIVAAQMAIMSILESIAKKHPETARITLKSLRKRSREYSGDGQQRVRESADALSSLIQGILDAKPQ